MSFVELPGIPQRLDDDLIIKACAAVDDIERVAALNAEIHGRDEGETVRRWLVERHPQIEPDGWLFVEDEGSGEAVATLGLMPLVWRYWPVSVPVAELGFVATRPAYRRRGLQRALSAAFDRVALANGYTLAAIEGIPYFYRQFGYEYALPLFDSRFNFALDQIPAGPSPRYSFRAALPADIPRLLALYAEQNVGLVITTERSEAMWHYYLSLPAGVPFGLQVGLILHGEKVVGYLALAPSGWVNRLNLVELALERTFQSGADARELILAVLRFARAQAEAGSYQSVGLQLPADHPASQAAREMGIKEEGTYGWQMKVLDPVRFLNVIAPALTERLAASDLKGYSGALSFDLYRQKVGLRIEEGRVCAVLLDSEVETDVNIPPFAATQLCLGWRSFAALDDWHKDVWAKEAKQPLLDILFPPLNGKVHIYLGY